MYDYPISISKQKTTTILDQISNSLYKIYNEKEGEFHIGFFSHIKYENKNFPVLITNFQSIYLSQNKNIKVIINNEFKFIELGEIKYFNKDYDISIIEIKENKKDKIYFLELDEKLYEKNPETNYKNDLIYIIHYNKDKNIYSTFGKIKDIINSKIICRCNINLSFKDSPIINLSNNKLIGVSKGNSKYFNEGIFFKFIIDEFINEYKDSKHNLNIMNEIDILINIKENDINKKIYFLNNNKKLFFTNNNLKKLNDINTELYINNIKQQYKKYFIPERVGKYKIKLKFNINLIDSSFMFSECENIVYINFIFF